MNSQFSKEPCQSSEQHMQCPSELGNTENEIQHSTEFQVKSDPSNDNLYLNLRFTQSCSIPILIKSMSPAGKIIEILSDTFAFQNMPLLLFKGKLLEPLITLKAQGVKNRDEIVIYDKVINSMLSISNQTNPFNNSLLNKLKQNQSVCPDFQTTPFEQKIFSILNEVNRLEDLTENSLYFDSDSEYEDDSDDYDTDFFMADSEENDYKASTYESNLQNSSLNSILNHNDENTLSSIKPAKTMKIKMLTVLGPEPKEVSAQQLPTCFQSPTRPSSRNVSIINCPSFKSFEDASRFFANNSSTYWKW